MTINREVHSHIYTRQRIFFFPCGTMFPHGSYIAGDVAASIKAKASMAWTGVHAIFIKTRA